MLIVFDSFSSLIILIPFLGGFMDKLALMLKILITEQKVNFLDNICHICEKIERWLMQHR